VTTRAAGLGWLFFWILPHSCLVLSAVRPGVRLERPQPRSGEDERALRRQAAEDPQERGRGRHDVGLSGVACVVPGAGWRSGLASTHPAPRRRAGGCHDHVSGTGLLSQKIERGAGAGSCRRGERTRGFAALLSHGRGGGVLALAASTSESRCQARVSSLRAIAMVAIFFPRLAAMAM
jgi:hypothetical protein